MVRVPRWLLRQKVTVEVYQGHGAYGPTYGQPVEVACRIEPRRQLVTDRNGREVVAEARLYAGPEVQLGPEDRVTWEGRAYIVVEARPVPDPAGRVAYVEAVLR